MGRLALGLVAAALLWLTSPGWAQAPVTLKFGTYLNENDVRFDALKHFATLVEQKTAGRVKVALYGSATLHPHARAIDALKTGISDISMLAAVAVQPNVMPCTAATHWIPAVVDWDRTIELDLEYNALMKPEFDKAGLVPVMSQNFSYDQEWFFRRPVRSLTEMKGLNVRTVSPMLSHIIRKFGGTPVQVGPNEMYQSAERGLYDGMNAGIATFSSLKMWEVMPHLLVVQAFYGNGINSMNKERFEALRPDDRQALLDAGTETARWLKPRYETWIDGQVGHAVLKMAGSAYAVPKAERRELARSMAEGWNDQVDKACGAEIAGKFRTLMKKYES